MKTKTLGHGSGLANKRAFHPCAVHRPEAHYDSVRGCYWVKDNRSAWIQFTESSLKRLGRSKGIKAGIAENELISPLDEWVVEVQLDHNVAYAGSLSGYKAGPYNMVGGRLLVTDSPVLIEPKPGSWETIRVLLVGLLIDEHFDQTPYFFGWLKIALESLRANTRRTGQALAIAGPSGCGKSLLQQLITVLLGGRQANPYQHMVGESPFNSHMFTAEHLVIEDEAASSDIRTRRTFGAHLKTITANVVQSCHAKNRTPVSLTPFWRLSITVNDEPENLMVLPPLDESIEDKLILLRARFETMPMPTGTDDERAAFWAVLVGELPAFVDFLLSWEIPADLRSARFGVRHFHHPDLLQAIDDLAPERRLLDLIDAELFSGPLADAWEGKAEVLEKRLTGSESSSAYEARRVLSFNTACGVYLARLAKKHPARVSKRILDGSALWTIEPRKGSGG